MRAAGVPRPTIVIGAGGDQVQTVLGIPYDYVWQRDQLGTGHAVLMAADLHSRLDGLVVVASGDTPLLRGETIARLLSEHARLGATCSVATARVPNPGGYGRIVRKEGGSVARIVEQRDCTQEELAIREVNSGLYVFDSRTLWEILPTLSANNSQGEIYLTDVLEKIAKNGQTVAGVEFVEVDMLVGVNDRWQLAEANAEMRKRILRGHALAGVTIIDPATTHVEAGVELGVDTIVEPNTHLAGATRVGRNCRIGPSSVIVDCEIGDGSSVLMSNVKQAVIGGEVRIGPFANVRPGVIIGDRAKIGNFVELKNAELKSGVAVSHLSYIGDASVGENANIGAGTITCNYDGFEKYRTDIGAETFVGSNSTLVAPLTIGDGAFIAAGSVITHDIPPDALGLGRARQEVKEGWVSKWRSRRNR